MEILYSIDDLADAARQILEFSDRKLFLFYGAMGTGKTTLIKALCHKLGIVDVASSPTFGFVNEYDSASGTVYHFDLYRLKTPEEALDFGLEDYLYEDSYIFVEWPEKVEKYLPGNCIRIELSKVGENRRKIILSEIPDTPPVSDQ